MEEILSSIKKIIAEDGEKSLVSARPRRAHPRDASYDELGNAVSVIAPGPRRDDDVLELTEMAQEDAIAAPPPEAQAAPFVAPASIAPPTPPAPSAPEIVSPIAVAATRTALESLSALVVKPEVTGTDTLEGMVREMLRPMLKEWLDARLPDLVEAMVAKEIARISGR